MQTEPKNGIRNFIRMHPEYFDDIPVRSLLPYRISGTESDYIFLAGSYLYWKLSGKCVTWLERRRFAVYPFSDYYNNILKRTISNSCFGKFKTLKELEDYLMNVG